MKKTTILICVLLLVSAGLVTFTGCEKKEPTPIERIEEGAEEMGEQAEETAEEAEKAAEDLGAKIKG